MVLTEVNSSISFHFFMRNNRFFSNKLLLLRSNSFGIVQPWLIKIAIYFVFSFWLLVDPFPFSFWLLRITFGVAFVQNWPIQQGLFHKFDQVFPRNISISEILVSPPDQYFGWTSSDMLNIFFNLGLLIISIILPYSAIIGTFFGFIPTDLDTTFEIFLVLFFPIFQRMAQNPLFKNAPTFHVFLKT